MTAFKRSSMKEVIIDIKGTQRTGDGEVDSIEFTTVGKYYKYKNRYHLSYPEHITTGMKNVVTTLKVGDEDVLLCRRGGANSELTVERQKRHICHYDTGYGLFSVGIFGKTVRSTLGGNGGKLYLKYTVDIDSGFQSENEIDVTVREN